jgi:SmpA / OmlA family
MTRGMSNRDRLVLPRPPSTEPLPPPLPELGPEAANDPSANRLFVAFRTQPKRRRRLPLLLAALALSVPVSWALTQKTEGATDIITRHGFKTVKQGMSEQQVHALLGRPLATDESRGADCYRYGMPSMETPSFVLYSVCFEDGKLRDVQQRRYSSWDMTRPGEMKPPPAPIDRRAKPGTL